MRFPFLVEGKENSMNVLNNNDSNRGLLKQFKVSKELQMIMKRKRQEEKEQQISTNLHGKFDDKSVHICSISITPFSSKNE